jgi:murein tripeptide amidase MpaA
MKKIKSILLFIIFLCAALLTKPQGLESPDIISVEKKQEIVTKLKGLNLDLLLEWNGRIYIIARVNDFIQLQKQNIPFRLETAKFYPFNQRVLSTGGGINGEYHSYQELEVELKALEKAYPQIARLYDIGDSLEKRQIYALKISDNVGLDEEEAEILFMGCHHAREWITVEIPFLLAKYLVENYEKNSQVKSLVDRSEIWVVPLVNPDGLEYSIQVYRFWRKNRRANSDGTYGVDINRNYSAKWGYDNLGSSPDPGLEIYRGQAPFSEPETKAIRNLFLQKNFQAMISYHSFSQTIMYPWGYSLEPTTKDKELREIAARMSELIQAVNGRKYEYGQAGTLLYITNGDATDWTFETSAIPSFTIELPPVDMIHGGFFNAEEDIQSIFNENLPAMLYLIDYSCQHLKSKDTSLKERVRNFPFVPKVRRETKD